MEISSLLSNSYGSYKPQSKTDVQRSLPSENELDESASFASVQGGARPAPPPPPQEADLSSDSESDDDELLAYLEQMYQLTGTIPGTEEGTTVSDLDAEQLENVRNTLAERAENGPDGARPAPPPPEQDISSLSEDQLSSLLSAIQDYSGALPGLEDSESLSVESLSASQLDEARNALSERQQDQFQDMLQNRMGDLMQNGAMAYLSAKGAAV